MYTEQALEALRKLRRLLSAGWTQGAFHKTRQGKDFYCLVGGLRHVTGNGVSRIAVRDPVYVRARGFLRAQVPKEKIIEFNDAHDTTNNDVLRVIDQAIAEAEKQVAR